MNVHASLYWNYSFPEPFLCRPNGLFWMRLFSCTFFLCVWVPGSFRTSYETSDVGLPSECPHFPSLPLTEWIEEPPCVPRQAVRESCLTGKQGLLGRCCSNDKAVANKWPKGQILTNGRWPLLKPRLREDPLYIRSTVSQLSLQAKGSCLEFSENPKPWSIYGCCCCVFSQFKLKLLTMTTMMRWFFIDIINRY